MLTDDDWAKWAPIIIRCTSFSFLEDSNRDQDLLEREVKTRAPQPFVDAYLAWIRTSVAAQSSLPDLEPLTALLESNLTDSLAALIPPLIEAAGHDASLSDGSESTEPLDAGVARVATAQQSLRSILNFLASNSPDMLRARAEALLAETEDVPIVWAIVAVAPCGAAVAEFDDSFERLVSRDELGVAFAREAAAFRDEARWNSFSEVQLGGMVRWLAARWGQDAVHAGWQNPEDQIRDWRDGLIGRLVERSNDAALRELHLISATYSGIRGIRDRLDEAEARQRDSAWVGPTPAELFTVVAQSNATVVLDEDDLYRAVLAAIERFRPRLRNLGQLLWNESRQSTGDGKAVRAWAPKYEPVISDLLLDHLRMDLEKQVVGNREVLVRGTSSKGHGLAVDVLIGGVAQSGETVTIPIEVKGCWNPGLLTDLHSQLVSDYLPAANAHRGIYVCAWFPPGLWTDKSDPRLRQARRLDREDVLKALQRQARASSSEQLDISAVLLDVPRPEPSARARP